MFSNKVTQVLNLSLVLKNNFCLPYYKKITPDIIGGYFLELLF
jgi:hypothetical protein